MYFEERLAVFVLLGLLVAAALWRAERRCPRALRPVDGGGGDAIAVIVTGAVSRPGEYRVPRGARGSEAAAAAGPSADADLGAVDCRLALAGGEVVYVPRAGEGPEARERSREVALQRLRRPIRLKPLDINRATAGELAELPGLGEKLAGAVVIERARAPFRSVGELRRVPGIGPATLEKLRGHVVVGQDTRDIHRGGTGLR